METYRIYNISHIKEAYVSLLGKNLNNLIEYIYNNLDQFPDAEMRAALSFNMLLISGTLINAELSVKIANDLESLRKNQEYLNKWKNPSLKRQYLRKELETLRKHTEIDDTISLNMSGLKEDGSVAIDVDHKNDSNVFDIKTGIETLNVSTTIPSAQDGNCALM